MTNHLSEEQCNDFVDDVLSEVEASPLRRHLEGCTECRAEILALRHLRSEALALPRGISPRRDLWAGIRSGIEAEVASRPLPMPWRGEPAGQHPLRRYWMSLASAAAALVVLTSAVTMVLLRPASRSDSAEVLLPRVAAPVQSATLHSASLQSASLESASLESASPGTGAQSAPGLSRATDSYERAAADLLAAFNDRKSRLQPGTIAAVEQNLKIVDEALRRAREALAADPANPDLNTMMTSTWQRKVDLLDKAVRLTSDL